jgi:hypothetical protein
VECDVSTADGDRYDRLIPNEQEMTLVQSGAMRWTNQSVVRFAGNQDPVALIERKTRDLVLNARDAGWQGPPFNPLAIAKLLNIPAEANGDVIDARTVEDDKGLRIQFNPTQPRERLRFSIAHEIAHTLFPDVGEQVPCLINVKTSAGGVQRGRIIELLG